MLLVAHGSSSYGVIRAFADGCETAPAWDKTRMSPMGALTMMEQTAGGGWRVLGSVCPRQADDGVWECCWRPEVASGADPAQM